MSIAIHATAISFQQAAGIKAADAVLAAEIGTTLKAAKRWREAEEYLLR
ncbi:MAG: hypothetical protein HYZ88_00905 [Candidatus Omnitrophica bacterium]|nr:hypothetical protein [Candidatus Omnitrophota bacterium]